MIEESCLVNKHMSMIMLIDNWNTWEWTLTKTLSENWALKIEIQLNLFFFDVWLILYVVKHLELALNLIESTLIYIMHKDDRGTRVSYLTKNANLVYYPLVNPFELELNIYDLLSCKPYPKNLWAQKKNKVL